MNKYTEMKERQQKEVNALPIKFAFSNKQFDDIMSEWGFSPDDTSKIYKLGSTGGFYRREDSALIFGTLERHEIEKREAIAADTDGTGYIYDMFLYELANHEYCVTYDLEPTLDACGLTEEEVLASPALLAGLKKAKKDYMSQASEW